MKQKELLEAIQRANERINRLENVLRNLATRQNYSKEITKPELKLLLQEVKIINTQKIVSLRVL